MDNLAGRKRVVITGVTPEIDGGHYPIKRTIGEKVSVTADIFADGHDVLAAILLHRKKGTNQWREVVMNYLGNDRWQASFVVEEIGIYQYTLKAWIDHFASWRQDLIKKKLGPGKM